jgi:hypothetical protein
MGAPQVRIGEDGQIVVDVSTLTVQAQQQELSTFRRVDEQVCSGVCCWVLACTHVGVAIVSHNVSRTLPAPQHVRHFWCFLVVCSPGCTACLLCNVLYCLPVPHLTVLLVPHTFVLPAAPLHQQPDVRQAPQQ